MTEQDELQNELTQKNLMLNAAEQIARLGHWQWDVIANNITWSDNLYRIYGLQPGTPLQYENYINSIHPDDRQMVARQLEDALATGFFSEYYHRIILPDGAEKVLHARGEVIRNSSNEVVRMRGTGQDVTEQKNAEKDLMLKSLELQRMNAELQEFAYVASHDLQEPLRKMAVFTSMLENDEDSVISEKGMVYMEKIVKSSARMRRLIEDILQFSRLNAPTGFVSVDLNAVLAQVLSDMEMDISKRSAKITVASLPVLEANATQMGQLFQNLLSNALKFSTAEPVVTITAEIFNTIDFTRNDSFKYKLLASEKCCRISIKDNGIGIDKSFHENIFTIFQRLNGKQYEGTGIGLAICKKIADNHNALIELQSAVGEGATFIITLPMQQNKAVK